jgi:hypothetical protein
MSIFWWEIAAGVTTAIVLAMGGGFMRWLSMSYRQWCQMTGLMGSMDRKLGRMLQLIGRHDKKIAALTREQEAHRRELDRLNVHVFRADEPTELET